MTTICRCGHRIAKMEIYQDGKLKSIHYAHLYKGKVNYPIGSCIEKGKKHINGMGNGYCGCTNPVPTE